MPGNCGLPVTLASLVKIASSPLHEISSAGPVSCAQPQSGARMESTGFSVTLTLRDGYAFGADFEQDGIPELLFDEPRPLGAETGPTALLVLAAAVANCLAASLLF